ncbi:MULTISPECIES: IclR family transcriptional regulator [Halomonas]|uniref:IclR family transcriptional regulator n=1 Tax=Halomonas TaxID=2745 RepID=UPI000EEF956E|nr:MULTISPECIES: IclR family transcriptional regulator C-terminal domain-containing protein [Halomonas]HCR98940.1 hypothetical protein [Halomonas sp.]
MRVKTPLPSNKVAQSSLSKGLALLTAVAEKGSEGINLSEASTKAGINISTAYRLLNALVEENFISLDPYSKFYHLGLMPYEIVERAGSDVAFLELRRKLHPTLLAIQEEVDGIVCLSVPSRGESLCIDLVSGSSHITINTLKIGARRPLGVGAASLALLASLSDEEREKVIISEAERYLRYGCMTAEIARDAVSLLDSQGYVFNDAYVIPDIGAIALPLFSENSLIGAISVTTTISRLSKERRKQIAAMICAAVKREGMQVKRRR